jgi:hypothetical protein
MLQFINLLCTVVGIVISVYYKNWMAVTGWSFCLLAEFRNFGEDL